MIRAAYRSVVPLSLRLRIRRLLDEIPIRAHDLRADLFGGEGEPPPLPPPRLRARVGTNSSREQFLGVGRLTSGIVRQMFASHRSGRESYATWLDFGCGSGRVARHLLDDAEVLVGIDVDREAVDWCSRNLRGHFHTTAPVPPTPLDASSIDLVYCISVFTHLDEGPQYDWLDEIRRILRPGGLFIVSTHPPSVTYNRPDLSEEDHWRLQEHGFLFARGTGAFNDDSAFHSEEYLRAEWSRWFQMLAFHPGALADVQDVSVWRRQDLLPVRDERT